MTATTTAGTRFPYPVYWSPPEGDRKAVRRIGTGRLQNRETLRGLAASGLLEGTQKGAWERHQARAKARKIHQEPLWAGRIRAKVLDLYVEEIRRRGGETEIWGKDRCEARLEIADAASNLFLLRAEGWRYYSSRFGSRFASISYLCGKEDGQRWAVRVPGTVTTVAGALEHLTPAVVRKAQEQGKRVLRQGDVWVVESGRDDATRIVAGALPDRHAFDPETRVLSHPEHAPVEVPFKARFVRQPALAMGRLPSRGGSRRRWSD